ncbi:hypothetical protein ZWY2020_048238 [Hordeum vulgare]|nr:hypothetical protein ZWY2020_048238 [Hordeum vulgare]
MTSVVTTAEVEKPKAELNNVRQEAAEQKVAAGQITTELLTLRSAGDNHKANVAEVQQELKDSFKKCEALEQKTRSKLPSYSCWFLHSRRRKAMRRRCIKKRIAQGEQYFAQCFFCGENFALLTRVWHSPGVFADLPKSATNASRHYASQEGDAEMMLFSEQFQTPEKPLLVSDQLKQLMGLHPMAEPAMKDLCIRLWPTEPLKSNYFVLVQKLIVASPRIDVLKRSVCIEVARMAFTKTMLHWSKLKPTEMASRPLPTGKEHRRPELYFSNIMEAALAIETQCSKDVFLE